LFRSWRYFPDAALSRRAVAGPQVAVAVEGKAVGPRHPGGESRCEWRHRLVGPELPDGRAVCDVEIAALVEGDPGGAAARGIWNSADDGESVRRVDIGAVDRAWRRRGGASGGKE